MIFYELYQICIQIKFPNFSKLIFLLAPIDQKIATYSSLSDFGNFSGFSVYLNFNSIKYISFALFDCFNYYGRSFNFISEYLLETSAEL